MSKPTEYLMTQKIVAMVESAKPSLKLLRLFHACYAYVDRNPLISIGVLAITGKPACMASCSDLSAITGSPSGKSNAWIKDAIEGGGWQSLFSQLELNDNDGVLSFKFSTKLQPASIRGPRDKIFAMIDSDEIKTISSANETLFYVRAAMVARANQPMFDIPHICPMTCPWTDDSKKTWHRIAARVGKRMEQHYLIIPKRDPLSREIIRVQVKVVTETSRWSPGYLFPRPPCPPIGVIRDGTFSSLKKSDLIARANWTRVFGP